MFASLKWLARHQNPDGSWSVTGYTRQCRQACEPAPGSPGFDPGVTGLSLLAFLGAGYSHLSRDTYDGLCFGDVVRRGLQWMISRQDAEGCVGPRDAEKHLYNHALCSLALSEAYGLTGSTLFRDQAQRAVDFLVAAQNPGRGWRYGAKAGDNDSSVTGWCVMALKSADNARVVFPRQALDGARAWFHEATDPGSARTGYTHAGTGKVYVPDLNESFDHHETMTAISALTLVFLDRNRSDARGIDLLLRDRPRCEGNAVDFYYWYCGTIACFQFDGPKGPRWTQWERSLRPALVAHQNPASAGCRRGSWEPVDRWSGEGGRVYGTAINALTLEIYYRYASAFGTDTRR